MGLLGSLLGGGGTGGGIKSPTTQTTTTSTVATGNVANYGAGPAQTFSGIAASDNSTINIETSDLGAIDRSFDFAGGVAGESFDFASAAFNTTRDALVNAHNQALSFVDRASTPADERTREQFKQLATGLIIAAAVVAVAFALRGGK